VKFSVNKKKMKNRLLLIVSLAAVSCTQELDLPFPQGKEQLVLNSFLHPDSIIKVSLTKSLPLGTSGSDFPVVDDAEIRLYENDVMIGEPKLQDSVYVLDYQPQIGHTYRVTAEVPGFNTLMAEDVVPEPAVVSVCNKEDTINRYSFSPFVLKINIEDHSSVKDYYWLETEMTYPLPPCRVMLDSAYFDDIEKKWVVVAVDSIVCEGESPLIFGKRRHTYYRSFSAIPDRFNARVDNTRGGITEYDFYVRLDDTNYDGKSISLELANGSDPDNLRYYNVHRELGRQLIVTTASQHYDRYLKSSVIYARNRDDYSDEDTALKFFSEITQTYSNIENGTGIFAAYNTVQLDITGSPCE
jgi:hypothetical protein